MKLRVALAAHTILYFPIYLVAARHPDLIEILPPCDGDAAALDMLVQDKADICISDPMSHVQQIHRDPRTADRCVTIGTLVQRTGLWAVGRGVQDFQFDSYTELCAKLRTFSNGNPSSCEVIIYSPQNNQSGSVQSNSFTANAIVQTILSKNDLLALDRSKKHISFGDEIKEINRQTPKDLSVVFTCDLVGAKALGELNVVHSSISMSNAVNDSIGVQFDNMMFTAIIARKSILNDSDLRPNIIKLLRQIKIVINELYNSDVIPQRWIDELVMIDNASPSNSSRLFPAFSGVDSITVSAEQKDKYCKEAIRELKDGQYYSSTLRIEKKRWTTALALWGFSAGKKDFDTSCDHSVIKNMNMEDSFYNLAGQIRKKPLVRIMITFIWSLVSGLAFGLAFLPYNLSLTILLMCIGFGAIITFLGIVATTYEGS